MEKAGSVMVDKQAVTKSWRTTAAGVAAAVAVIAGCLAAQLDADPATVPDWSAAIGVVIAALGLAAARDHGVTSEAAGAR